MTAMDAIISKTVEDFKSWFTANGGLFHPDAQFQPEASGYKIVATKGIPADTTIVTCPFKLVITKEVATRAISTILGIQGAPSGWTERQLISTYISFHWVFEASPEFPQSLAHFPYIKILPRPEQLITPLHFSEKELETFKGSHLYAAAVDRKEVLQGEWKKCLDYLIATPNGDTYRQRYTWEHYLTAATYVSSRGFPSTLISEHPSVNKDSYPVLFPGVDSLNHGRGRSVSWVVDPLPRTDPGKDLGLLGLSLLIHSPSQPGEELLNNYGAKPNSELILGYGFSLEGNPDDTIVLSIGGVSAEASTPSAEGKELWEVGRNARGVEGVWRHVLDVVSSVPQFEEVENPEAVEFENQIDAGDTLSEMCQSYLDRLPRMPGASDASSSLELRPAVLTMFTHYIEGQRDILESMLRFAEGKEKEAVEEARKLGIEIELE